MEEKSSQWGTRDYDDAKQWIQNIGKAKVIATGSGDGDANDMDDVDGIKVNFSELNMNEIEGRKFNTVMEQEDYYTESDYYDTQVNVSEDMKAQYTATAPPMAAAAATQDFVTDSNSNTNTNSNSDSNSVSVKFPTAQEELWFVVPGKIVHLVKDDAPWVNRSETIGHNAQNPPDATYSAVLADYNLKSLQEITPIIAGVKQHTMGEYTQAMRAAHIGYIRLNSSENVSNMCLPSKKYGSIISKPIQKPGSEEFNCCSVCNVDGKRNI